MSKASLALILCVLVVSVSHADRQSPPPTQEETAATLDEAAANAEKLVAAAKSRADSLKAAKDALEKPFNSLQKRYEGTTCGIGCLVPGTGDETMKKELDAAKPKLEAAKKALAEAEKEVLDLNSRAKGLASRSKDVKTSVEKSSSQFLAIMRSQGVMTDFLLVKNQVGDTDRALDKMSALYDKTLLGAYVKDKVGLLLNSQLICQARKRCDVKEPVKIPNSDIEDALFPKTGNSTRQQQYYDKINPGKRTEGTTN